MSTAGITLKVFTDGCAKGNPGPAGIGVVFEDDRGSVVFELSKYIGTATNNVAEYTALICALEEAQKRGARTVHCHLDSELVVRQLQGSYKVKHDVLKRLYARVRDLVNGFATCTFAHIPREENTVADRLANDAVR